MHLLTPRHSSTSTSTSTSTQATVAWGRVRSSSVSSSITTSPTSAAAAAAACSALLGLDAAMAGDNKYEIRRGKMVPKHVAAADQASFPHPRAASIRDSAHQAARQRPHRPLQLPPTPPSESSFTRSSRWRPASSIYSNDDDSSAGLPPRFSLTSHGMYRYAADEPVSPPSSPELGYVRNRISHVPARDVSLVEAESLAAVSFQVKAHRNSLQATLQQPDDRLHTTRSKDSPRRHESRNPSPVVARDVSSGRRRAPVPPPDLDMRLPPLPRTDAFSLPFVDDGLHVAPLSIPSRGTSTRREGAFLIAKSETNHDGAAIASAHTAHDETPPISLNQTDAAASKPQLHLIPSLPDSGPPPRPSRSRPRPRSPPPPPPSSAHQPSSTSSALRHSIPTNPPPAPAKSVRRKPAPPLALSRETPPTSRKTVVKDTATLSQLVSDPAWVPPPSRFSVTTCATSVPDTPRQSIVPPLPILSPKSYSSSITDSVSSLSDGGSVKSPSNTTDVSRGTLYSALDRPGSTVKQRRDYTPRSFSTMGSRTSDCGSSIMSVTKPLPLAPPELSAPQDRIAQLNVYIQSLMHRRLNIDKSIQQMTELMPLDSLFASDDVLRKREMEKLKVQALKDELADIQREEYDAGLKLFFAYKRSARNAKFEQTSLWVRNATS